MDILLDTEYAPQTANGDFVTSDSLLQDQQLLLATNPGEWKENPLTGVGVVNFINSDEISGLPTEIKRQFKADGIKVNAITINNGEIQVDAERN